MKEVEVFIKDCPRCGEDHGIYICKLTTPIKKYSHFAMCLVLKEPILITWEKD